MDGARSLEHPRCASHCSNSGPSDLFSTSRLSRPVLCLCISNLSKGFSRRGSKFSPSEGRRGDRPANESSLSFHENSFFCPSVFLTFGRNFFSPLLSKPKSFKLRRIYINQESSKPPSKIQNEIPGREGNNLSYKFAFSEISTTISSSIESPCEKQG